MPQTIGSHLSILLLQENFGSNLSVMMTALSDLQKKGDILVTEVRKQKNTLDSLNSEIKKSESNLASLATVIKSKEQHLSKINTNILKSQKSIENLGKICAFKNNNFFFDFITPFVINFVYLLL